MHLLHSCVAEQALLRHAAGMQTCMVSMYKQPHMIREVRDQAWCDCVLEQIVEGRAGKGQVPRV